MNFTTKSQESNSKKLTGTLVLVRHAESEWNLLGKWTGRTDVHLTDKGRADAKLVGQQIQDIAFDIAFYSGQIRTLETLHGLLEGSEQHHIPHVRVHELNERDYGEYTGMNKWEVQTQVGDEVFQAIRRSWDYPIPGGETLADVYDRAVPFYEQAILPRLEAGENVLIVSHGNTIRALMKQS